MSRVGVFLPCLCPLPEISRGKVMFSQNPLLSHMGTVAWDIITRGRPDSVHLAEKAFSFNGKPRTRYHTRSKRRQAELPVQSVSAEQTTGSSPFTSSSTCFSTNAEILSHTWPFFCSHDFLFYLAPPTLCVCVCACVRACVRVRARVPACVYVIRMSLF